MECCPFLDRLIDLGSDDPLDPELEFHLLICEECREAWDLICLIRSSFPHRNTPEQEAEWVERMIPKILAKLPPPRLTWARMKPTGRPFLEWGPWRETRRPG